MVIHVVTVRLDSPGRGFVVTPASSTARRPLRASLTSDFLRRQRCQVAINGDFFYPFHSNSLFDYYPHVGDSVELEGQAWSRGLRYSWDEYRSRFPTLFFTRDNRATFSSPPAPYNAIAGDALFMRDGQPAPDSSEYHTKPEPRTAVALDRQRKTLLLIVVDGRQPGYSDGATFGDLVAIVRQYGGWDGLNLDGGGSTDLVIEGPNGQPEVLNCPINNSIPGRERAVANHLGIFAR
jgi:exopolysaccharide biosynthesis protein